MSLSHRHAHQVNDWAVALIRQLIVASFNGGVMTWINVVQVSATGEIALTAAIASQ